MKKIRYTIFFASFILCNVISYFLTPADITTKLILGTLVSFAVSMSLINFITAANRTFTEEVEDTIREKSRNRILELRKPDGSFLTTFNTSKFVLWIASPRFNMRNILLSAMFLIGGITSQETGQAIELKWLIFGLSIIFLVSAIIAPYDKAGTNERFTFFLDQVELLSQKILVPYSELDYLEYGRHYALKSTFHTIQIRYNETTYISEWTGVLNSKSLDSTPQDIESLLLFLGFEGQGTGLIGKRYMYNPAKKPTGDLTPIPKKNVPLLYAIPIVIAAGIALYFYIIYLLGTIPNL